MTIDAGAIMMGVNWSVQLIGLLSAWKQERSAQSDDNFKEFLVWLQDHNFGELCGRIENSDGLNRQLHKLLGQSMEEIGAKIDSLAEQVGRIATTIDGLNTVDRAVHEEAGSLSTQAREMLKMFAEAEPDDRMSLWPVGPKHQFLVAFIPSGVHYTMSEPRFLLDDASALESADLISMHSYSNSGHPIYILTRRGASLAATFPPVEIIVPGQPAASSAEGGQLDFPDSSVVP